MKPSYSILTLVLTLAYAIVVNYLPDFPISEEVFQTLIGYLIIKASSSGEVVQVVSGLMSRFAKKPEVKAKKK